MSHEIRLACMVCDREDFDGISELPDDWDGISEAEEMHSGWWTHLGWCPDCKVTPIARGAVKSVR